MDHNTGLRSLARNYSAGERGVSTPGSGVSRETRRVTRDASTFKRSTMRSRIFGGIGRGTRHHSFRQSHVLSTRCGPEKTNLNSTRRFLSCCLLVAFTMVFVRATRSTRRTRQRRKKGGWYVNGETGGRLKKRPSISVRWLGGRLKNFVSMLRYRRKFTMLRERGISLCNAL